ncbi:MAG: ABC transporter substrate-binding protein [Burkholderiales bacterium]
MIAKAFCVVLLVSMEMFVGTPLFAAEQAGRLPRIGVLWPALVDQWVKAFHEGLRENGYIDGATAVVDIRATGGNFESGPTLADELVALDPDVIYAVPAALAKDVVDAQTRAGKQIPMVVLSYDPVSEGLVASAARPGASITGIAGVAAPGDLVTKHLQLLRETLPRLKRVAFLIDTTWYKEVSLQTKAALERAGPKIGVRVDSIDMAGRDGLERALSEVVRRRVDAMIIPNTAISLANRNRIIDFASKNRLPTAYWEEVFAYEGGLMSYGMSIAERYRSAARVVAKILHGAKPADIPVDYSMRFRLVVNLQTAKALRLPIPQSVLIQADEVIK